VANRADYDDLKFSMEKSSFILDFSSTLEMMWLSYKSCDETSIENDEGHAQS
jgi:hypothetical protein